MTPDQRLQLSFTTSTMERIERRVGAVDASQYMWAAGQALDIVRSRRRFTHRREVLTLKAAFRPIAENVFFEQHGRLAECDDPKVADEVALLSASLFRRLRSTHP